MKELCRQIVHMSGYLCHDTLKLSMDFILIPWYSVKPSCCTSKLFDSIHFNTPLKFYKYWLRYFTQLLLLVLTLLQLHINMYVWLLLLCFCVTLLLLPGVLLKLFVPLGEVMILIALMLATMYLLPCSRYKHDTNKSDSTPDFVPFNFTTDPSLQDFTRFITLIYCFVAVIAKMIFLERR